MRGGGAGVSVYRWGRRGEGCWWGGRVDGKGRVLNGIVEESDGRDSS